jgi:hypothetical protein
MQRNAIFSLFLGAAFLFGCAKDNNLPGFDLVYRQQFEIPAGIGVFDVHHFYLRNLPSRFTDALTTQGKTNADITGVITAQASLTGLFGDANFNFVEQVSVRIYQESKPTDYVEIAYRLPVPLEPGNRLDLIPSLADSKRFVQNERFSLDVVFWLRRITQERTPVQLDLQLKATF